MKIDWKSLRKYRKYLAIATDIVHKLPDRNDGLFKVIVKLLAIADSFEKNKGADNALYAFFSKLDANQDQNAQFVDLFFSTPLNKSFEIRRIMVSEYVDIVIASDAELGTLYFIEYHWGSQPEPSTEFWASKGFNFQGALARLWTIFESGIHISLKMPLNKDRPKAIYRSITFTKDPILGSAMLRLNDLVQKHKAFQKRGFPRTYLFVGKQGIGKSTCATRVAQACGSRILSVDSKGMTVAGATDLSFLISGLQPDFLIFDDIDRVADLPSAVPTMLDSLSELKARHPSVTAILTANSVEAFDPAILRPGRIDKVVEFEVPAAEERRDLLAGYLLEFKAACSHLDAFVEATEGLTAAYLRDVAIQLTHIDETEVLETIKQMKRLAEKAKGSSDSNKTDVPAKLPIKAA
jgi:hypothetical protein